MSELRKKATDKLSEIKLKVAEVDAALSSNLIPCGLATQLDDLTGQLFDIIFEMECKDLDWYMSHLGGLK